MSTGIKGLYRDYFQKSKVFLYPILEIPNKSGITPIQTYLGWKEQGITPKQKKLICLFHNRKDAQFINFENSHIKNNPFFDVKINIDKEKIAYTFDFTKHNKDWNHFINGCYSKFSLEAKRKIKLYFRGAPNKYVYVESFLIPEKYYHLYSELLQVSVNLLEEAVELTDRPDIEKEMLEIEIENLKTKKV